jgi:hypothetical protein
MVTPYPSSLWAKNSPISNNFVTTIRQFFNAMASEHYHVASQVKITSYALYSAGESVYVFRNSS